MFEEKINKLFDNKIEKNVALAKYTTMKVGGLAKYFYVANNLESLIKLIVVAKENNLKYFIIGGGSNIVVSDNGYDGLVILNRSNNIVFIPEKSQVICDSGVSLMRLIIESANRDLGGLESLYGIPGTVGGAVYGNAGAGETEICSVIKSITLLSIEGNIVRYKGDWLNQSYRSTRLKADKKRGKVIPVILSITLQLVRQKKDEIMRKIQYHKSIRDSKNIYKYPSCGSVFKNLGKEKEKTAGYILDTIGAKKMKHGGAEVFKDHANFIINKGEATANDVRELVKELKILSHEKYGVDLEEEIEFIG